MHLVLIYLALGMQSTPPKGEPAAIAPAVAGKATGAPAAGGPSADAVAPDPFDVAVADVGLLQIKSVQGELKIGEEQRTRMNTHADAHQKALQAYREEVEKKKIDPAQAMQSEKMAKIFNDLKKGVLSELTATQIHRLREITLQRAGIVAIGQVDVAKRVGLNDGQLEKFRGIFQSDFQKVQKLREEAMKSALKEFEGKQPKSQEEANAWRDQAQEKMAAVQKTLEPKIAALAKQTEAKLIAFLTPAQKENWKALQGASFTIK